MRLLEPRDFDKVAPLVPSRESAGHMAFVHSVISGTMTGHVAVDDLARPRSALVCNLSGFYFAVGEPNGPAVAKFMPELLRTCLGPEPTLLWATTLEWAETLTAFFAERRTRNEYHPGPRLAAAKRLLREGYRLVPIDPGIATKFGHGTDPWVVRVWGGPSAFGQRVFGVAALAENELASFCTACAIGGVTGAEEAEVEIGTAPEYRRRGLAYVVACEFIDQCRERDLFPAWTCDSDNLASAKLAEALGFVEFRRVVGYLLSSDMRLVDGRWTRSGR